MKVVRHLLWAGVAAMVVVLGATAQEKKTEPDPKAKTEPPPKAEPPKAKTEAPPKAEPPKPKTEAPPKAEPEPKPKAEPAPEPKKTDQGTPAKVEEITQGFRAYIVAEPRFKDVRNREGKLQDLVTDHGLNPVIAVFSRVIPADANHPLAAVVKKLDELAGLKEYKARKLGTYLVFIALTNEYRKDPTRDTRVKEVQQFVAGVMPKLTTIGLAEATVTVDEDEQVRVPAQVTAIGIGAKDDIVIVFYYKFGVVKRWKFTADAPPGEADLAALDAEVAKLLGPAKRK